MSVWWRSPFLPDRVPLLAGLGLSRLVAYGLGVRFDAVWFGISPQYLDEPLLRDRLLETIFYQHTQPPLLNLAVGVLLKLSPFDLATTLAAAHFACGIVITLVLFRFATWLGLRRRGATVAVLVVMCLPDLVLAENSSLYDYPLLALTVVTVWALARYLLDADRDRFPALVACAGALVLARPFFHPLWYVVFLGSAAALRRPLRPRRALLSAGVPLLLVAAVIAKNQALFGSPALSSFFGMNLGRVTVEQLPRDERERLIANGTLSPAARIPGFLPESNYRDVVPPCERRHPDVPVLSRPTKSTGDLNFNDECYLRIFDEFDRNSVAAARAAPSDTARSVLLGAQLFFMPLSLGPFYNNNREALSRLIRVQEFVELEVSLPVDTEAHAVAGLMTGDRQLELGVTDLVAVIVAMVLGTRSLRRFRTGRPQPADAARVAVGMMTVYVVVVGTFLEVGENYRFRFAVEPLVVLTLIAVTARAVANRRGTAR